jgi:hypothetical protein
MMIFCLWLQTFASTEDVSPKTKEISRKMYLKFNFERNQNVKQKLFVKLEIIKFVLSWLNVVHNNEI